MYCRSCGKQLVAGAAACIGCGLPPLAGEKHCQDCGAETNAKAVICVRCGVPLLGPSGSAVASPTAKSKLAAGLLGIFLGWLGVHRFYLGYNGIATAQLILGLLGVLTFGITSFASWVWGVVDAILILTGSLNKDGKGLPLRG